MTCFRPATPGFLVTLVATGLLAVVVFSVPYIKSIYFLKATLNEGTSTQVFTFGVLGYCVQISGTTTCSSPSVGYSLNVNQLLGDDINDLQIPNVLVKWLTDALVLHIVALVLAALSAVMGLLAHCREMSMVYCSTFFSGFAAAVTLTAFIFDIVLFFVTKSRINDVDGSKAEFGIGVWLTLAAWIILFLAGCFYGLGRCCIRRRPRGDWDKKAVSGSGIPTDPYAEQMRLDAIRAENERKARQADVGPTDYEALPLKESEEQYMEDGDHIVPYHPDGPGAHNYGPQAVQSPGAHYAAGYAQAPVGTRAVDAYYSNPSYPPQRQPSGYAQSTYSQGGAYPSQPIGTSAGQRYGTGAQYNYGRDQYPTTATAAENYGQPATTQNPNQYYTPGAHYGNDQYASGGTDPQFSANVARGTSYQSAASHQQYPSADPYAQPPTPSVYSSSGHAAAGPSPSAQHTQYTSAQLDRSYTLGGSAYAPTPSSNLTALPHSATAGESDYFSDPSQQHAQYSTSSPTSTVPSQSLPQTSVPSSSHAGSSARAGGLRVQNADPHPSMPEPDYEDSPPMYDAATAQPPGTWGEKH